jgi:hypothetical protein
LLGLAGREAQDGRQQAGAWIHIDGAFGLFGRASHRHRAQLEGAEQADSWATDGVQVPSGTMRRFWTMTAHYSGGIWNSSEIGRSLGEAHTTVKRHLDALSGALVVRVLEPWYANVGKRLVKSPKVCIRDSGLLHTLLGIGERRHLEGHPVVGGSSEGFVIEQLLAHLPKANAYYWRTQAGAELDLLLFLKGRRIGVEIKRADAPRMTPSMGSALKDLALHRLRVVYQRFSSDPSWLRPYESESLCDHGVEHSRRKKSG